MIGKLVNRFKDAYLLPKENWQVRIIWFGVLAVALSVYLVIALTPQGGPEEQRQGGLLKNIAAEIQYPRAKPISERVALKVNQASFIAYYKYTDYTPAQDNFKNVAEFYHQQLTTKGWTKDETDSPVASKYRKQGGYEVSIYEGDGHPYDFNIYVIWNRP